jgi:hypothetical protein
VDIEQNHAAQSSNITVSYNAMLDICHNNGDCEAIYYFDGTVSHPPLECSCPIITSPASI